MPRTHRAGLALLIASLLTPHVRADDERGAPTLPTNNEAIQRLETVREYVRARFWSDVARLLQRLLDDPEQAFLPMGEGRWVSVRSEVERLLGELPASGREAYQTLSGGRATGLLTDARKSGDVRTLQEVVRRFRQTEAGREALELLGTHHLDRGRPALAAACFEILLRADTAAPTTLLKAVLAFRQAGDRRGEALAWKRLEASAKQGVRLGARRVSPDDLRREVERLSGPSAAGDWSVFRGDSQRRGVANGATPHPEPRWQKPTAQEKETRRFVANLLGKKESAQQPLVPGAFPVAVGGKFVYHGPAGTRALDPACGREIWAVPANLDLDPIRLHQAYADWQARFGLRASSPAGLLENTLAGALSADAARVYVVEDLTIPPWSVWSEETGRFRMPDTGVRSNRLRALEGSTGSTLWELGDSAERSHVKGSRWFLGPPLPLAGWLYTLREWEGWIHLLALDPESGKVDWSQPLCQPPVSLAEDYLRRTHALQLALGHGVLVCPTNCGAVVGIDLMTRDLAWAHVYPPAARPPPWREWRAVGAPAPWKASAPLVQGDCVILASADDEGVICLGLRDGRLRWRAPRRPNDVYLAGVFDGRLVVVGRDSCRAVSLADGRTEAWRVATGLPAGLGVAAGALYYLPTRDGVVVLDLARGAVVDRFRLDVAGGPGNLLFHDGELVSQSAVGMAVFPRAGRSP